MKWLNIDEFLPSAGQEVLIWSRREKAIVMAHFSRDQHFEKWEFGQGRVLPGVTWWMPLPEPPPQRRQTTQTMSRKVIFLDLDGVLINRAALGRASGLQARADAGCVAALNRITEATKACIVISSTWRRLGFRAVRDDLREWGVTGKIYDMTPELHRTVGDILVARPRYAEIRQWLQDYRRTREVPLGSFVILDDSREMGDLASRLITTDYEAGLTEADAERAIKLFQTDS